MARPASMPDSARWACAAPAGWWLYPAVVLGTSSRRVVGWSMPDILESALVVDALNMVLWNRRPKPGLSHHIDRGCQCASLAFG